MLLGASGAGTTGFGAMSGVSDRTTGGGTTAGFGSTSDVVALGTAVKALTVGSGARAASVACVAGIRSAVS